MMARILVADDEAPIRELMARVLGREGHAVTLANDGGHAAEIMASEILAGTPFDLLLSDIVMPVMDGIALALHAANEQPGLRIVLMTGFAAELERVHNLDDLVHAVVRKPFLIAEMIQVIEDALNR